MEETKEKLARLVLDFGVEVFDEEEVDDDDAKNDESKNKNKSKNKNDLPAAVALLLFGDAELELPGGYSTNELSELSPIKRVKSFPQELVLLGRATVLLKGIAKRLNVKFSLADKWYPICAATIQSATSGAPPPLPLWGRSEQIVAVST